MRTHSYNNINYVVRRNVFDRAFGGIRHPVIGVRRNPNNTNIGAVLAYNNAIISLSAVQDPGIVMEWKPRNPSDNADSGNSVFLNNIVMNAANDNPDPTPFR